MSRTPSPRPALRTVNTPRDLLDVFEALTPDDLTARSRSLGLPDDALDYSVIYRLIEKIDAPADPDACWPWNSVRQGAGYGLLTVAYRHRGAHRLVYAIAFGPVPAGRHVLHACDNPPCVNPAHLHTGTPAQNQREASDRGRSKNRAISRAIRRQIPDLAHQRLAANGGDRAEAFAWLADIFGISAGYVGTLYDRARRVTLDAALPSAEQVRAE